MKFTRLTDSAIKCHVSKEELDEYGVELEDLMCNRDKAELFLRHIMTEAKYELDFDMPTNSLAVSINVMPEGDISLMIADKSDQSVKDLVQSIKDLASCQTLDGDTCDSCGDVLDIPAGASIDDVIAADRDQEMGARGFDGPAWAELDSLETVIRLSKQVAGECFVMSQLYKHNDRYYLRFELNDNSTIGRIYIACSEYSSRIFLDKTGGAYIMEHGKLLMNEDAIFTLADL